MKNRICKLIVVLIAALVQSACVNIPTPMAKSEVQHITMIATPDLLHQIELGKTTKQELQAKLGKTRSVSFDSGFEVWVYQYKYDGRSNTNFAQKIESLVSSKGVLRNVEVVILIDPQGIVSKKRVRYPPTDNKPNTSKS